MHFDMETMREVFTNTLAGVLINPQHDQTGHANDNYNRKEEKNRSSMSNAAKLHAISHGDHERNVH